MTLRNAAQDAINLQNGCNSSGIARTLVQAIDAIRAAEQKVNTHPIVFMILYKLMALNGHEPIDMWDEYTKAEAECKAIVEADAVFACTPTMLVVVEAGQ